MLTLDPVKFPPISRAKLHKIPVPTELPPYRRRDEGGSVWKPIQHGQLADAVVDRLVARGFGIETENWTTCKSEQGLIGTLDLDCTYVDIQGLKMRDDSRLSFGVRHSNNGLWALTCLVGARIMICSNGMMVGDFAMSRKHTTHYDLGDILDKSIDQFVDHSTDMEGVRTTLEGRDLSLAEGDHLIVESATHPLSYSATQKVIPWKLADPISREWRHPRHQEFKDRNAWSLYMAMTECAKVRPAQHQIETFNGARKVLVDYCAN
jgi:hypothetical protein